MQEKCKTIESLIKETFENGSDRRWVAIATAEVAETLMEGIKAKASPFYKDPLLIRRDEMLYLYSLVIKALRSLGLKVRADSSRIRAKGTVPIYSRRARGETEVSIDFSIETVADLPHNREFGYWLVPKDHLDRLRHICEFVIFVALRSSFENHPEYLRAVSLSDELVNELCALAA